MKITKKITFNVTLVEILFNISGSTESNKWNGKLNSRYITKINTPYIIAFANPFCLFSALLVKKETVNGIIGNTQGVSNAIRPPMNPKKNMVPNPLDEPSSSAER